MQNALKKKKNSEFIFKIIIGSYFSMSFFVALFCCLYFIQFRQGQGYYISLVLVFAPASYVISNIIHEIGHWIIGMCCGLTLYDLSIPFLRVKKVNGNWTIKRNKNSCFYCHMGCDDDITLATCVCYLSGGILLNFITFFLGCSFLIKTNIVIGNFLITISIYNLAAFFRNGIMFRLRAWNDGMTIIQLLSNRNQVKLFNIQLKVNQYLAYSGSLQDIECFVISDYVKKENDLSYYVHMVNYYINLAEFKIEDAYKEIEIMLHNIHCYSLAVQESILVEQIYMSCLMQKKVDDLCHSFFLRKNMQRNYDYYCALYFYMSNINNKNFADSLKSFLNLFYNEHEKNEYMRIKHDILNM